MPCPCNLSTAWVTRSSPAQQQRVAVWWHFLTHSQALSLSVISPCQSGYMGTMGFFVNIIDGIDGDTWLREVVIARLFQLGRLEQHCLKCCPHSNFWVPWFDLVEVDEQKLLEQKGLQELLEVWVVPDTNQDNKGSATTNSKSDALVWRERESGVENPVMTFSINRIINTELFIDGKATL